MQNKKKYYFGCGKGNSVCFLKKENYKRKKGEEGNPCAKQ